jgi:hypothetical protein
MPFRKSTDKRPVSIARIVQRGAAVQNAFRCSVEQNLWPIRRSSLPGKPGRTRGSAVFRQIVVREPGRRDARGGQVDRRLRRVSKSPNSGEAPRLFACPYFTGSPEFHVLEMDANAVHCGRCPLPIRRAPDSVGSHVGWNDASPGLSEAQVPASVPLLTRPDPLGDTGAPPAP